MFPEQQVLKLAARKQIYAGLKSSEEENLAVQAIPLNYTKMSGHKL
jgi:hypothetical protein